MSTTPITSNTTATAPQSTKAARTDSALGKDDFLKLMIAQLRSQDPMQPTDDSAYIGQLAQFTQLEQVTNLAQTSSQTAASEEQAQAVALIGRAVSYIDPSGLPKQGSVQSVQITSSGTTLTIDGVGGVSTKNVKEVS